MIIDKAKLLERLLPMFIDELGTHVRTINDDLLALEKAEAGDDKSERVARLFRAAHSLKGAARAVDQPAIERVSHYLEDVFTGLREERVRPRAELFTLLFSAADAIEAAGMQLREKAPLDESLLERLIPQLQAAANDQPPTTTPVASSVGSGGTGSANVEAGIVPEKNTGQASATRQHPIEGALVPNPNAPPPDGDAHDEEAAPAPVGRRRRGVLGGSVRVAEGKLDSLLAQVGELLVARQRVERGPAQLEALAELMATCRAEWQRIERALRNTSPRPARIAQPANSPGFAKIIERNRDSLKRLEKAFEQFRRDLVSDVRQLQHASSALQDDVHRIRMLPFQEACAGLDRTVRDLATVSGKEIELIVEGGDIEVDRSVLEGVRDPLLHLVRNAVDHGMESPEERRRRQKPLPGVIRVVVRLRGSQVEVIVSDDGRGLDLEKIRAKLREKGWPEPPDARALIRQIFLPGFSTASIITDVSGRGVGLDVVKSQVELLRGTIDVATTPQRGTQFTLSVPLTLTTIPALFIRSGGQTLAVPSGNVVKLIRFHRNELRPSPQGVVIPFVDAPLPVISLAEFFQFQFDGQTPSHSERPLLGVVLSAGELQAVALVDDVLSEREVVVKNLGPRILRTRFVSGATLLPSGRIALLLNVANLLQSWGEGGGSSPLVGEAGRPTPPARLDVKRARRLLLVDDSLTTRTLLKSILEAAGYAVAATVDGRDAWERLQQHDVDLVVSDVDMPRMDGFQLTEAIRGSARWRDLPVVLITARDSEADKANGVTVGADAYLVKSAFDQTNLLETIAQLL